MTTTSTNELRDEVWETLKERKTHVSHLDFEFNKQLAVSNEADSLTQ